MPALSLHDTLEKIKSFSYYVGQIKSDFVIREKQGEYAEFPDFLEKPIVEGLKKLGIGQLYKHQEQAAREIDRGANAVVSTSTSSGKSLCYWLPILNDLIKNPGNRALVLYPTKALAQDQLRQLEELIQNAPELMASVRPAVYDGDTPAHRKKAIRSRCNIILTNPDMLHSSILPINGRWGDFFFALKYVVLDEAHMYRGIFGSHVALVMARLKRLCMKVGASPIWMMCSATIYNPLELAEKLSGEDFVNIYRDSAPSSTKRFVTWKPEKLEQDSIKTTGMYEQAQRLLRDLALAGHSIIAFTQTRLQ
jgi:DEAD/DEAH box helicase domain-containing protein